MRNFNTNQTRNFYVASKIASTPSDPTSSFDEGAIAIGQTATGELYFKFKNYDGNATRSDSFLPSKVTHLTMTAGTALVKPLRAHIVAVDTSAVTLSELVGKTLDLTISIHQVFDYDMDNTINVVASVVGNSTNTASAAAFHKALAIAIAKALPKNDPQYPFLKVYSHGTEVTSKTAAADVTGSNEGVVLVEAPQRYVRGKLTGEPCPASVAFRLADRNVADIIWGKDSAVEKGGIKTVAEVNTTYTYSIAPATLSGTYELADLEWFAYGEKGDMYRGYLYPNDYNTQYRIDLSKTYNVLNIEFYWSGENENVQKSKRMIQVAAEATVSNDIITTLYEELSAKLAGVSSI